jgi:hypothetical protein
MVTNVELKSKFKDFSPDYEGTKRGLSSMRETLELRRNIFGDLLFL